MPAVQWQDSDLAGFGFSPNYKRLNPTKTKQETCYV